MGVFPLETEGVFPLFIQLKENITIRDFCMVAVKYVL